MPSKIYKNVLLFGGGIDSICLAYRLSKYNLDYKMVFIDYGQKARAGELASARYYSKLFGVTLECIKTNAYSKSKSPLIAGKRAKAHALNYIPIRNQMFIDLCIINNPDAAIHLGFHKEPAGSVFYDAKQEFINAYNGLLISQKINASVLAININKSQKTYIVEVMKAKGINFLNQKFSCYESNTKTECGRCTHCKHSAKVLSQARSIVNERRH